MALPYINYFKSIRQAALELGFSYYFLYNCFHQKHDNQFKKFISITKCDRIDIAECCNNDYDDDYDFEYPQHLVLKK